MSIHRETGLPYGVYQGFAAREAAASGSLKRKANPSSNAPGPSTTKKQKATPGDPISALSPDAKRLLQTVLKTQETALRRALATSIMAATPSDLVAYQKLLGSLTTSNQTPLHCVRCHASYLAQENNTGACRIPHDEPEYLGGDASDDYPCSDDGRENLESMMKYPCCGERFCEDDMDGGDGFCVEAPHTIDPKKVEYFIKPTAASKKKHNACPRPGYYDRYKNKNSGVVTCKQKKCPAA
ncbi:hypothetical protein FRC09_005782 [Ceratobasidium sp. 395]|nr:hypothetical protein FRC09_005782 [Ceratobasidium sp. 395]